MSFLDEEELEDDSLDHGETTCDVCGTYTLDGVIVGSFYLCDSCYANELDYDD